MLRDRATGQVFDPAGLHPIHHKGRFFQVEGPLYIGRSPQGQPVISQAGSSGPGIALARKYADAIFTNVKSLEEARAFTTKVRDAAQAHGRARDAVKSFPGISPIVGRTRAEAQEKYAAIKALLPIEAALAYLGRFFDHHDFSQYDLDAPFPDLGDLGRNAFQSTTDGIKAEAKGRSLRDVALEVASPRPTFLATGAEVAAEIIRWIDAGASDGFILGFAVQAQGLEDFVTLVLPELEAQGRFTPTLTGQTLRENLGLPFKVSRHLLDKAQAE